MGLYYGYYVIFGIFMLISWLVGNTLKRRFKEYSKITLQSGLSGRDVAEKMLHENNIFDVKIISVPGQLSDHYNPMTKTVNLSEGVYNGRSVASAAVAAHECGHAVQHATAYSFLKLRTALVPVVNVSSNLIQWVLLGGILLVNIFPYLLLFGIGLFAITTLFSFITLPVEFDASRRALVWIDNSGLTSGQEHTKAANALKWAASTYVVAALASLATLLYYIWIFMGRRN